MLISSVKISEEELREEVVRALADVRSRSETDGVPGTGEIDE